MSVDEVRALLTAGLRELDPAGVGPGAPPDEYQIEATEIARRLPAATSVRAVQDLMHQVMVQFFGPADVGQPGQYRELAQRVWSMAHGPCRQDSP
ncbi:MULTISPECIES: hypothetical protein [unclassified Luteococcus]|uniref:hypothetical protein n=1 Tax=unclassified Luteococcus TaxID=2639923 RepID=UPI00313BA317